MSDSPLVLLLAGGENSRFFPLNTGTHKGGRTVAGQSLIERCIENLQAHNFTRIRIVVSQKDFGGQGLSSLIQHEGVEFVLQAEPNGQADAILAGLKGDFENTVVTSPYYLHAGELAQNLLEKQVSDSAECVVLASQTDQPSLYGMLELEGDRLLSITEKAAVSPSTGIKINSFYLLNEIFLKKLAQSASEHYALEETLNQFAKEHHVAVKTLEFNHPSLKFSWQLLDFMKHILESQKSFRDASAKIAKTAVIDESKGPVVITSGADIRDFVVISGPAYIGENVLIGEYSFIRESAIEAYSKIGARTEIARSLISTGTEIHAGYCADSILGDRTTVGAGLITANLRLDNQDIHTMVQDKKQSTHRRKLGIVTGDDCHIGVRVTTMPGTLVGDHSTIYPSLTISHTIPSNTTIKVTER